MPIVNIAITITIRNNYSFNQVERRLGSWWLRRLQIACYYPNTVFAGGRQQRRCQSSESIASRLTSRSQTVPRWEIVAVVNGRSRTCRYRIRPATKRTSPVSHRTCPARSTSTAVRWTRDTRPIRIVARWRGKVAWTLFGREQRLVCCGDVLFVHMPWHFYSSLLMICFISMCPHRIARSFKTSNCGGTVQLHGTRGDGCEFCERRPHGSSGRYGERLVACGTCNDPTRRSHSVEFRSRREKRQ